MTAEFPEELGAVRLLTPAGGFQQQGAKKKRPAPKTGRVHFTQLDQVLEGEPIMTGTFLTDGNPAVVPFDSGASHTFISHSYASRCGFEIINMEQSYQIIAPDSPIVINQIVWQLHLKIGGKVFSINPLVLPHQGVDVIIGMNCMKEHQVVLDVQTRTVQLRPTPKDSVVLVQLQSHKTLS